MKILTILIFSLISAILYRLGGHIQTKIRDFGVPTVTVTWLLLNGFHNYIVLFFTFGLIFAAQTTYFKKKGQDAEWYHWIFVGLAFSLSTILIPLVTHNWMGFLYRVLITTTFTCLWSQFISKDWLEEGGRGFIQVITLPLLTGGV